MKTIAHLLPNYNPFPPVYPAGTELRVAQVARRQTRYHPIVVCGGFPGQIGRERVDAMDISRIHFGRIYRRLFQKITRLDPWPYGRRMWNIIRTENSALLHIHNEPKLLAMLAPFLRVTQMPVVVHIANDKPIPSELVSLVTHWVACSDYMAQWLHEHIGVSIKNISVIYTGVDISTRLPRWAITADEQAARRARWSIDPTDFVFLFAGRLVEEKGVTEMLDAFERIKSNRKIKLLVAGNIRESKDPRNKKAVYGRAVSERMANMTNVRWVGSLHPDAMHDFLLVGDAFLLPSLWHDPFPTVMLEAACAGLPILASRRGGITEFLDNCPGIDLLQDPSDTCLFTEEMHNIVNNPDSGLAAGRWLRAKVETSYDWSRVTEDFEALYDKLLEGKT